LSEDKLELANGQVPLHRNLAFIRGYRATSEAYRQFIDGRHIFDSHEADSRILHLIQTLQIFLMNLSTYMTVQYSVVHNQEYFNQAKDWLRWQRPEIESWETLILSFCDGHNESIKSAYDQLQYRLRENDRLVNHDHELDTEFDLLRNTFLWNESGIDICEYDDDDLQEPLTSYIILLKLIAEFGAFDWYLEQGMEISDISNYLKDHLHHTEMLDNAEQLIATQFADDQSHQTSQQQLINISIAHYQQTRHPSQGQQSLNQIGEEIQQAASQSQALTDRVREWAQRR